MSKFLDSNGLSYLWGKIQASIDDKIDDAVIGDITVGGVITGEDINVSSTDARKLSDVVVQHDNNSRLFSMVASGKIYSVSFASPDVSMSSAGTREDDAVGMVANPSTDTERGVNDFDNVSPYNIVRCNGYVDPTGEPVPTCFEGDPAFKLDGTNGDVWAYGVTPWFKIEIHADGSEKHSVSDKYHGEGWFPNPGSIRPDGTVRPYVMTACYRGGIGKDGKVASISGVCPSYGISYNSQLSLCREKGAQYCGYTSKDHFYLHELFTVEYATLHCQSVMIGRVSNSAHQCAAEIQETGVKRIVLTNVRAAYFYVGGCVSIGYSNQINTLGNFSVDRSIATMHEIVNRVPVTAIEPLEDGVNTAIYVDAAEAFDTTNVDVTIRGTVYSSPVYISTMPNYTGMTDCVLGPSGSPVSNTDGRYNCRYRYVENPYGDMWLVVSDVIKNYPNIHTCYLCENFAASITSDYEQVGYELSAHSGNGFITNLGFDPKNPSVRLGTVCTATNSTRHADAQRENQTANINRGIVVSGYLFEGQNAGFAFANLIYGLSNSWYYSGLRLSATGRCGRVADVA